MSINIEQGFISKLVQEKDLTIVKDLQIKNSFFSGDNKKVYLFVTEFFRDNGIFPSDRILLAKFPHYPFEKLGESIGNEENLIYWGKELRLKVKHNSIIDLIEESASFLESYNTDDAYNVLKKRISYIENEIIENQDVDITQNSEDRILAYQERKSNLGMRGISSGITMLDYLIKGFEDKTLTTVIANTGVGKTWFEILVGCNCMLNDCKVLQLVTEMSEEVMQDRYDAMLFSLTYGAINYSHFKSGRLSKEVEEDYFEFLRDTVPKLTPLIISTATGVTNVRATIEKYEPDIVFIDGVYLMEDDREAKDDWKRVTNITRDLKKLAKDMKLPIIINTQADKNTSKKTGPELGDISFAQSIGQDSDNVLTMYRDAQMLLDGEMCLKLLKQREGILGRVFMNWNFDTMDFSNIYSDVEKENEEADKDIEDRTVNIQN